MEPAADWKTLLRVDQRVIVTLAFGEGVEPPLPVPRTDFKEYPGIRRQPLWPDLLKMEPPLLRRPHRDETAPQR